MGLAIQLNHRFGSKWLLNKLHRLGYTESFTETQNYKYCFLNDSNIVEISGASGTPDVFDVATDEEIDDEMEVDVELEGLSVEPMKVKHRRLIRCSLWRVRIQAQTVQSLSLFETT